MNCASLPLFSPSESCHNSQQALVGSVSTYLGAGTAATLPSRQATILKHLIANIARAVLSIQRDLVSKVEPWEEASRWVEM